MCCHTRMSCHRHRTWHPTPSQYTDTGPTCRCAIHWCRTSHWYTQYLGRYPIGKCFPDFSHTHTHTHTHTPANDRLYDSVIMVVVSQKLDTKCTVHNESWTRDISSPTAASLKTLIRYQSHERRLIINMLALCNEWILRIKRCR